MKLKTKLLTAISSIAIVSTVVPTTVSCGCSKKDYLFNYADHVNCRDKDDRNYHKPKEVKSAAKIRAPKAQRQIIEDPSQIESMMWDKKQFIFYDFIASIVIQANEEINLKDWNDELVEGSYIFSFNLNGKDYPVDSEASGSFFYEQNSSDPNDKTIYLNYHSYLGDPDTITYRSYAFSDCQWAEQGE